MTNLRNKKKSLNPEFQAVHVRFLNPKSISMGELYGEFNAMTQEWHDGLASSIMREFVNDSVESEDKKWTVFDGQHHIFFTFQNPNSICFRTD